MEDQQFTLPFRQIHLDFHTSPDIEQVGAAFDAEEFAATLEKAHVNSVTLFAKCHHGMLYYDSKVFPERVHPHLVNKNMLNEQIAACHRHGIRTPIYITVQWDHYTARQHPEWVCVAEDGSPTAIEGQGQQPYEAGFYQVMCVNSPYRDLLKAQVKEVLELFNPADGLFFDIVAPVDCSCRYCLESMKQQGFKPHVKADRIAYYKGVINTFKLEMTHYIRTMNKDCSIFYNMGHVGTDTRPTTEAYTHFELESLPSGGWGYLHFPSTIRYARTLGLDCLGQTGKFHTMWGDFHSFKNKAALEFECFHMLALGSKCLIGDQLEPCGRLSQPVYDLIGSVYSQVEACEPWCRNVKPVVEIGLFTPEEVLGAGAGALPPSLQGAVRMLQESQLQFDVVDSKSDYSKYRLLILPDNITLDSALAKKLSDYIQKGGRLIASFESGLNREKDAFALAEAGVALTGDVTLDRFGKDVSGRHFPLNDYAEYLLPHEKIGAGLPLTEHVMYQKGKSVSALPGSEILADNILSYFDRTYEHFCSHRQSPSSGKKGTPAIVQNGSVIYFSHPVFTQYYTNAPLWCKKLLINAVDILLNERIFRAQCPSTMLAAVNAQPAQNRTVVHLLHYIPERRCQKLDIIEDVIPLYGIPVSLKAAGKVTGVACVPQNEALPFTQSGGRVEFTVPKIDGHQMVCITFEK